MNARVISAKPLSVVCAPGNPIAGHGTVTIDALRGVPVILRERGTAVRELIMASCAGAGFSPLPRFETSDPGTIRHLAASGLGISAVPMSWLGGDGPPIGIAELRPRRLGTKLRCSAPRGAPSRSAAHGRAPHPLLHHA